MRRVAWTLAAGALVLLAGCADPDAGGGTAAPPAATTTAPSPTPSSAAPSSGSLPTAASPAPTGSGKTITVDGVVERGVEPGCLVLTAGTRKYLLQGSGSAKAPVEVPVRVTGQVLTGQMSYCQQGTPFRVLTITRR